MKLTGLTAAFTLLLFANNLLAQTSHELWLQPGTHAAVKVNGPGNSPTLAIARQELQEGWNGKANGNINLVVSKNKSIQPDGFRLSPQVIEATTDKGILYGVYELLRRQKTGQHIGDEICNPSYDVRTLNHWDNLNGSVERGYAGYSIFWRKGVDSFTVTDADKKRWTEYARANASIGINGSVLNNVNASPLVLTSGYLKRLKAVADIFRPYGVKTYLAVNFSSPKIIGGLSTSDPLDAGVKQWWKDKAKEIYALIPDFGGFLVKANSEGQPGPQDFGRTHVDGANTLADAVNPYGGIIMWRAFVYSSNDKDRAKQAYMEFVPFDGQFRDNVIIQVKNGPIDFQPREPFSPLFGAMKKTPVMAEFQVTQEYLGHSTHLAFLSPMWEETLQSDTYQEGPGSTVARCTDGSLFPQKYTAIAGVSNVGLDTNWTGHDLAQANWYAFGRLAWNNQLSSSQVADEWVKLTYQPSAEAQKKLPANYADWTVNFLDPVKWMLLQSREAVVNYMTPLGLHHIMSANGHYGPGPWWGPKNVRPDWTPLYYHQADAKGIGFNRTKSGSDAVEQYHEPLASMFNDPATCPDIYLLWFHHLPWNYMTKSGRTLWDDLCYHYDAGIQDVRKFQQVWDKAGPYIDSTRFTAVQTKLRTQLQDALIWKDACLLYFQQYSGMPIPYDLERPVNNYANIRANEFKQRID